MKIRHRLIGYPFLFAIWPLLSLYADHAEQLRLHELIPPLLIAMAGVALLWFLIFMICRQAAWSGLVASLLAIVFLVYTPVDRLSLFYRGVHFFGPAYDWLALVVVLLVWWRYARQPSPRLMFSLHAMALFLVVTPAARIAALEIRTAIAVGRVRPPAGPGERGAHTATNWPNIFLIMPDGYARADVLRSHYDLDNGNFIRALRQRGFFVASRSYANYGSTLHALAATLNMEYLDDVLKKSRNASLTFGLVRDRIPNSRLLSDLAARGYRFVAFPTGYGPTEFPRADEYRLISAWTPFAAAVLASTPLAKAGVATGLSALDPFSRHRARITGVLDALPRVNDRHAPVFVLAHIVAPHPPFVFLRDGRPAPRDPSDGWTFADGSHYRGSTRKYRTGYREQLIFLNSLLLDALDGIQAQMTRPTVIVLQSDHGPGSGLDWDSIDNTDLKERFAILNAVYFPDGNYEGLDESITPINTFRHIMSRYFDCNVPRLPDQSWFFTWDRPFDVVDITAELP